jgi:glycosyltransferase involved in cell wall biosynthesis
MRVLHLHAGNLFGGIESLLVTLARQRALCPDMEPEVGLCFPGRLADEVQQAGGTVHDLGRVRLSRPWTVWSARQRLAGLLRARPYDVVVTHGCWPHVIFAPVARRLAPALVFWAHNPAGTASLQERWARRTPPHLILCNSRHSRDGAVQLFPGVRAEVLHYPVAEPDGADRRTQRQAVRAEFDTPDGAVVVVMSSRLEGWKGHHLLLDALQRLHDLPGWAAWVAGGPQTASEGRYLAELRQRVDRSRVGERIRFLGQRRDVPRVLAAADVHCQPNTGPEPFGIAFVEALYAGLPVVTTALGGALEIVDPSCGILVPPGDAAALAAALRGLVEDPTRRHELGAVGPARAAVLCEPSRQLRRLHECLARTDRRTCAS